MFMLSYTDTLLGYKAALRDLGSNTPNITR